MTILVAFASAHWSTKGIAEEIADRLAKGGFRASVRPVSEVDSVAAYEAVVLGSAIHNQEWLAPAAEFLERHTHDLAQKPVWLFSVSSVGETSSFFSPRVSGLVRRHRPDAKAITRARDAIHPRDHHHFAGAVQRGQWGRMGDLLLKLCGGSNGDHRDWHDVDEWSARILRELEAQDRARERRRLRLVPKARP